MEERKVPTNPVLVVGIIVCSLTTAFGQIIHEFTVAPGWSVSPGDVVVLLNAEVRPGSPLPASGPACVFSQAGASDISIARLSAAKVVVAFHDETNAGRGTAVVGAVAADSVVFGSRYTFSDAAASGISLAALSDTEFVIAWRDDGGQGQGKAIVGSVSGQSISLGWPATFNAADTPAASVERVSGNTCVVAFRDAGNGGWGTTTVGEVSNQRITFGQKQIFRDSEITSVSTGGLSDNGFVVAYSYRHLDREDRGAAKVGRVSGNVAEFGSESLYAANLVESISVAGLSATKFVVTFWELFSSEPSTRTTYWRGAGALGEVSGSLILLENFLCGGAPDVAALSETGFVIAYTPNHLGFYSSDPGHGTATTARVWQRTPAFGREMTFRTAQKSSVSVAGLSATEFAVAYRDTTNGDRGTVVVSDTGGATLGIAAAGASGGELVPVVCQGISENHADLSVGMTYYVQADGRLTPEPGGIRVGVAISPTELLLDLER